MQICNRELHLPQLVNTANVKHILIKAKKKTKNLKKKCFF